MISGSVSRVFYEAAANLHHNNETVLPLLTKTTFYLVALGAIPTVLLILFGPDIFDVIFGSRLRPEVRSPRRLAIVQAGTV